MLSEMSEKNKHGVLLLISVEPKINKLANITKKKQTYRYGEQTSSYQRGEEDRARELRGTNYRV